MDFKTLVPGSGGLAAVAADALLIIVTGTEPPAALGDALGAACRRAVTAGDFAFKAGRTVYLTHVPDVKAPRVVFAWAADPGVAAARRALAAGLAAIKGGGSKHVAVASVGAALADGALAESLVDLATAATYVYRSTKPSAPPAPALVRISLVCEKSAAAAANAGLQRGQGIAAGVSLARELANRPGNHCTPTVLAAEARKLGKAPRLKVEVLDTKAIEKIGMGSFLSVAQGSDEPPKFIVLRYQGAAKSQAPVVLVGKGITFDSGGISLKPGDVVTSLSGQTIEVLNTDAEGRLILCDALTYAERFKPAAVVDMATLTGACVIALGHHRSGLFSPDDALAAELLGSGEAAYDPAWRMPLDEEYAEGLKSSFADVPNIAGRDAGAITAAMFLKRFAGKYPWAHLDIAGSAWKTGAAKAATGRPVGLLTHFLLGRAAA
jgi:leucyl aminopeptidase